MATLFYLPSDTSAAVSPTASTIAGQWDSGHNNTASRQLLTASNASALTNIALTPDVADHLVDLNTLFAQFVSVVLPPQSMAAQPMTFACRCLELISNNNLFMTWKVYACSTDGTSTLGTLVALRRDGTECSTSIVTRLDTVTSTLFSSLVPFRLVLEVGLGGLPTASAGVDAHNGTMDFGALATIGFVTDTGTTAANPWLLMDVGPTFTVKPRGRLHPIGEGFS